jgi:beta-fructofuranosidase/levanase/fructan beta-fructosidase
VDWGNKSGLGDGTKPPLIAFYTYHEPVGWDEGKVDAQTQGMAYSHDNGRTWKKYEGNPVVKNPGIRDFRDPNVVWYAAQNKWIMSLAVQDHIAFYSSTNLIDWTYESDFGLDLGAHTGVWECPDLFPIKVDGTEEEKWVLLVSINPGGPNIGSVTQYFVGGFDGRQFTIDPTFMDKLGRTPQVFPAGEVFADFEHGYGDWAATGGAFGEAPATGKVGQQNPIEGFEGKGFVNTFLPNDGAVGTLTSPEFTIEKDYINFLIGGGQEPLTCMRLTVGGKTVAAASGRQHEHLKAASFDVRKLKGQKAQLVIVDSLTGGWGHINVDQIIFSDEQAIPIQEEAVWMDYGPDSYAGVSWSDIPTEEGRRLLIAWMSNWKYAQVTPTEKWRSAMTVAREIKLKRGANGYMLHSYPVKELESIRGLLTELEPHSFDRAREMREEVTNIGTLMDIETTFDFGDANTFTITFQNTQGETLKVGVDKVRDEVFIDRTKASDASFSDIFAARPIAKAFMSGNKNKLRLLIDHTSVEVFLNDGAAVMTARFFPSEPLKLILLESDGEIKVNEFMAYELNRIWD